MESKPQNFLSVPEELKVSIAVKSSVSVEQVISDELSHISKDEVAVAEAPEIITFNPFLKDQPVHRLVVA